MLTLQQIRQAHQRISGHIVRTPLLRLQNLDKSLGCQVYIKAECMQITGAFKLRGAMNKILSLPREEMEHGIITASSGNHGRAVAYAAKLFGLKATIVMPETAPAIKKDAIRALGATLYLCDTAERFQIAEQLCREQNAVMIPPFNDENIMAGQGTIGIEIMEQCPAINTVIVPVSGGGLLGGVSTAIKSIMPQTQIYGAEPAALPRYSVSLAAGQITGVTQNISVADALVAQIPGDICFPYVAANTNGFAAVADNYILKGMKLLLSEGKIFAEPSACIGLGAVLQGLIPVRREDKVCFLISGGNTSLQQLEQLVAITL